MQELEIVQHRQVPGLTVFINRVDYRTIHIHREWELIWVLEHPLRVTCGAEDRLLEPGQMVLFAPDEPHGFRKAEQTCTFLCIQISPEILPLPARLRVQNRFAHECLPDEKWEDFSLRLKALAIRYFERQELFEMECLGGSILLLHSLMAAAGTRLLSEEECTNLQRRNSRIHRLMAYVDANYAHKITLRDFAEQEGCSVSHLSHFIKESLNQTFQEYVTSVRFDQACRRIAEGKGRMLDICNEAGFSDYRYFTRAFREQVGMTPEEYARSAQGRGARRTRQPQSIHSMEQRCSEQESLTILRAL